MNQVEVGGHVTPDANEGEEWISVYEERDPQRFYNHARKIVSIAQPDQRWFQDVLSASGLRDLCQVGYVTIPNGMLMEFAERWHQKTSSFHLPHGEITITLDDVACLLHLPIRGIFLDQGRVTKEETMEMLIAELGADPTDALDEVERTRGMHVRLSFLQRRYDEALRAAHEAFGNEAWILQHFPDIIGWGEVPTYTELMSCASAFSPLRGNQVSDPYRRGLDRMAVEDVRYDCYAYDCEMVPFDEKTLYSGWLAASSTIIRRVVDVMIRLAHEAFMYGRHRARTGGALDARGKATRGHGGRRGGARGRGEAQDDV
ncbi:uncharacterized protein LOC131598662 [Vicia villosa]|uniref:uncharacterized protein LOC131598662 n=1 Tax=Vicia villosa TaxID=3911 RepID=UPI00273C6559|nr:uncharacterized protein LOC131598662 [Vicia villosa]